jgi:hypothetical protein
MLYIMTQRISLIVCANAFVSLLLVALALLVISGLPPLARAELLNPEVIKDYETAKKVISGISDAYEGYKKARALIDWLQGTPNPSLLEVQTAILSFIRQERNIHLQAQVQSLMERIDMIGHAMPGSVKDGRLANWLDDANDVANDMIFYIRKNRDPLDALDLAAALNELAPIQAQALLAVGNPPSDADDVLNRTLQIDYEMVGAWETSRNNPALSGTAVDRKNAILWQEMRSNHIFFIRSTNGYEGEVCNLDLGVCGPYNSRISRYDPAGVAATWRKMDRFMNREPIVKLIETSMALIIGRSTPSRITNVVMASDGSRITLVNPIGLASNISLVPTGSTRWSHSIIPTGVSNGDGTFRMISGGVHNLPFLDWATRNPVRALAGDFNGDGRSDVALLGGPGCCTIPVALANADGSFHAIARDLEDFANAATLPGAQPVVGDFNGDGLSDIALVGIDGWSTIPVAFSRGDGTFWMTNSPFPLASIRGTAVVGDFNGDGCSDIVIMPSPGSAKTPFGGIPVAYCAGNGTFTVPTVNSRVGAIPADRSDFIGWAQSPSTVVAGDFDGDGADDLALVGGSGSGWGSIPVALAFPIPGYGFTKVVNLPIGDFAARAQEPSVIVVSGDFDGDGLMDIALTGGTNWTTVPVAFSRGDGGFSVTNRTAPIGALYLPALARSFPQIVSGRVYIGD